MVNLPENAALRILFLSSIPRWGGGERWMLDAANGLAARGHHVLLAARPGARLLDRARDHGLRHRAVRMGGDLDPRALVAVRRALSEHRADAVFVNLDKELRYVCLATLGTKRPMIFQRRGSDDPVRTGKTQRWTYTRCATRILTNSETLAQQRFRLPEWMPHDHVRVMRNGVPVVAQDEPVDRAKLRFKLRLPRRNPIVVHIGELEARKGQEITLAALAALRARSEDPRRDLGIPYVAFVGTGPDEAPLRDRCHALGVQDHVMWLGFRDDTAPYLAAADLCVLPSRAEGTPWTILEAMAQGTPVVASAVSGIPEIVEDGVNGLLIPPEDPGALAKAIGRVLADTELANRLAQAARGHVQAHWSAEAMLDDLECLMFAELLRHKHKSGRSTAAARVGSRAALFVDRDGTLVHDVPYNGDPEQARLVPGAARALRWVRDAGIPTVVITNQSGVAQGLHTEDDVRAVHDRMRRLLQLEGADVDGLYYCPHHPEHGGPCDCRKPQPGLLLRAMRELEIDAAESLMIGDAQRDLDAAHAAGVPAAALTAWGDDHAIERGETVYRRWTEIVRDFLLSRWTGTSFGAAQSDPRPKHLTPAPGNGPTETATRSR